MPPVGFEPTIPAGERPQTYTLDRAATGTGENVFKQLKYKWLVILHFFNDIISRIRTKKYLLS